VVSLKAQTKERATKMAISEQAVLNASLDSVPYGPFCYTPPLDSTSCRQVGSNWARLVYIWSSRGRAAPRRPRRTPRVWRGGERGWFDVASFSERSSDCAFRGRSRLRRDATDSAWVSPTDDTKGLSAETWYLPRGRSGSSTAATT
jgi:hypothetical protein